MSRRTCLIRKTLWQQIVTAGANHIGAHNSNMDFWRDRNTPLITEFLKKYRSVISARSTDRNKK